MRYVSRLFKIAVSLGLASHFANAGTPADIAGQPPPAAPTSQMCCTADCPQWGGSPRRNNAPRGSRIPLTWDPRTGWNMLWSAPLGTETNGTPIIANGHVYIGTNNGRGYLPRYPATVDLGCLLCFEMRTGEFLWQLSVEKLPTGKPHDYDQMGICSSPFVKGDRLWVVTNRGQLVCLDTDGFRDGWNDGPFRSEAVEAPTEADIVWSLDMMHELGVLQHNMANCSVTGAGGVLFVNTSNGVDKSHEHVPAPEAPSLLAVDQLTGQVLWSDNSPGANILHGQWSSPAFAVLGGLPQVIFAGGDGWLYSFNGRGDGQGHARLLWKCDCNPKDSVWRPDGGCSRSNIIATPVIHDGLVYVATGEDPEKPARPAHLWCINPTHKLDGSDVSAELAVDADGDLLPPRRGQAVVPARGERAVANPASAVVWRYDGFDQNGDGRLQFEECLHRTISSVAVSEGVLILPDLAGVVHCLDARTGQVHWTHDLLDAVWASPLIVDGKIFIATASGQVAVFRLSPRLREATLAAGEGRTPISVVDMGDSIHGTPVVADNVLYIASRTRLYAIDQSQ